MPARICLSRVDRAGRWDTFLVRKRNGWGCGLKVEASQYSGSSLVGVPFAQVRSDVWIWSPRRS